MKELENLKKEYLKIQTPQYLNRDGWYEISQKLDSQDKVANSMLFTRGLTFAAVTVLLLGSLFTTSQAAKPGAILYPVKILSDDVVARITGNYEANIEKRAQEVIDTQNSRENFDKASEEYLNTLKKSKRNAQEPDKREQFKKTLEEQEQKLKDAQEEDQSQNEKFKEIIDETRKARGEVEGVKSEFDNGSNHENENRNRERNGDSEHSGD